ncbi:MAG: VanZ family protein [Chthoniobacterales bacterium]
MNKSRAKVVRRWVIAIGWMLLIFIGSSNVLSAEHTSRFLTPFLRWLDPTISVSTIAAIHFTVRKLGHFTEYAVLALLLWRALRISLIHKSDVAIAAICFGCAAIYAASDEFHQSFIPSRTSSPHDVLIDCVGAAFAIAICWGAARSYQPATR